MSASMNAPAEDKFHDSGVSATNPFAHPETHSLKPHPPVAPPFPPAATEKSDLGKNLPQPKASAAMPAHQQASGDQQQHQQQAWYRKPIASLNIDGAVAAALPQETADLLFWRQPVGSGIVFSALLLAPAFIFANFGFSKLLLLAGLAELTMLFFVVGGIAFNVIDRAVLKNDPPRKMTDVYLRPHLQEMKTALAPLVPTREQFISNFDSFLQQAQAHWQAIVRICYNAEWAAAIPVIIALHAARMLLRTMSLTFIYYSALLLTFTVPVLYTRNKSKIDGMLAPTLEAIRSFTVRQFEVVSQTVSSLTAPRNAPAAAEKNKAE